jgi:hypothetical protein
LLLCRVVPLFRGYTGYEDEDSFQEEIKADEEWEEEEQEEEEEEGGKENNPKGELEDQGRKAPINFGRPLQPAQQLEHLTTQPDAYWALMVANFSTCKSTLDE